MATFVRLEVQGKDKKQDLVNLDHVAFITRNHDTIVLGFACQDITGNYPQASVADAEKLFERLATILTTWTTAWDDDKLKKLADRL